MKNRECPKEPFIITCRTRAFIALGIHQIDRQEAYQDMTGTLEGARYGPALSAACSSGQLAAK